MSQIDKTESINPIEDEPNEQDNWVKTRELLANSGQAELMAQLEEQFPDRFSDWPVAVDNLPDEELISVMSQELLKDLDSLLALINFPDLAKEYPFSVLSSLNEANLELAECRFLFNDESMDLLKSRVVEFDPTLAQMAINEVAADDVLNAFVLCHTHPSLPAEETQDTIAAQLGDEIKQTYKIKPPGLNLSAQDLYQLVTVHEQLKDKMTVYLGVLMFDGKLVLVRIKDNKFVKTEIKIPVNNDTSVQADSN